jgi:hypothetical protein
MTLVDFHNPFYLPEYLDALRQGPGNMRVTLDAEGNPRLHYPGDYNTAYRGHCDIAHRSKVLERAGIDVEVLTLTTPGTHVEEPARAVRRARLVNNAFARIVAERGPRFTALASLPLNDPAASVAEFERAVGELGFHGALLFSNVNGVALADERNWPLDERAAARNAVLHIHPTHPVGVAAMTEFWLMPLIGFLTDTTLAAAYLVFAGVSCATPAPLSDRSAVKKASGKTSRGPPRKGRRSRIAGGRESPLAGQVDIDLGPRQDDQRGGPARTARPADHRLVGELAFHRQAVGATERQRDAFPGALWQVVEGAGVSADRDLQEVDLLPGAVLDRQAVLRPHPVETQVDDQPDDNHEGHPERPTPGPESRLRRPGGGRGLPRLTFVPGHPTLPRTWLSTPSPPLDTLEKSLQLAGRFAMMGCTLPECVPPEMSPCLPAAGRRARTGKRLTRPHLLLR